MDFYIKYIYGSLHRPGKDYKLTQGVIELLYVRPEGNLHYL